MIKPLLITILFFGASALSSCASILNHRVETLYITHDSSVSQLWIDSVARAPGEYDVRRSPNDIQLVAKTADGYQTTSLVSRNSAAYWLNTIYTLGVGLILERNIPERWTYPTTTFLRYTDGVLEEWRHEPISRGMFGVEFGLPYGNWYNMDRPDRKASSGFVGLELGTQYYFEENSRFGAYAGVTLDFPVPMGPVMIEGTWRSTYSDYLDLRVDHLYDLAEFGAGLSVARMGWSIRQDTVIGRDLRDDHTLLGLSLSSAYRIGRYGSVGLVYHPYFVQLDGGLCITYEHHISFIWKTQFIW